MYAAIFCWQNLLLNSTSKSFSPAFSVFSLLLSVRTTHRIWKLILFLSLGISVPKHFEGREKEQKQNQFDAVRGADRPQMALNGQLNYKPYFVIDKVPQVNYYATISLPQEKPTDL